MRRVITTVVGTVVALVVLLTFKTHSLTPSNATPPAVVVPSAVPPATATGTASAAASSPVPSETTPSATPSAAPTSAKPSPSATATKAASVRTVDGTAVDTRYGAVQVQVSLSGSSITKITVLQIPNRERRDVEINDYAAPILAQEVLQAQSAQINMVSGATYTSEGYIQSLQSALDKAGKAS